jgi:hypothetical protein
MPSSPEGADVDRASSGARPGWWSRGPAFVVPRLVGLLTVLILLQLVTAQGLNLFPRVMAIDFFGYWRVAAARRLSDQDLGSPYRDRFRYRRVLTDAAERTDDPKLREVGKSVVKPQSTGSPLIYVLFAALPASYTRAVFVFNTLQVLLFVVAVVVLGLVYRYPPFSILCLGLLLVLGSGPLFADLRVGNVGCFQLVALAALLAIADRLRRDPHVVLGGLLLAGLTVLALAKPNVALVAVVMGLHLWVAYGTRFFAITAVPAAVAGAVAVIVPCLVFGSWTVWREWYFGVFGRRPLAMARSAGSGNYSTARLFSIWLGVDLWTVAAVVAAGLALSMLAVLAWSLMADARMRAAPVRGVLTRLFRDPHLAMAIGVTVSLALPHLVWYHYFLLAIIPSLWLMSGQAGPRHAPLWGLGAFALSSGLLNVIFLPLGWTNVAIAAAALSWTLLWVGILLRVAPAGTPETQTPSTPPPAADQGRRPRGATNPQRARSASRR